MNSYDDSTLLPNGVVKLIQNMLPKKTSLETRTGWALWNAAVACTADQTTDIFTSASHGLTNTERIYFKATTLPAGISEIILYYIINKTDNTFQVSLTSGGAPVNFTTNGTAVTWIKGIIGSSGIFGMGYYAPTTSLDLDLAVSNGKLYSGAAGVFTERYDGLSTNTPCSITQFDDKALIVDQVNKMRVYKYGETTYTAGIDSPKEWRLIEDFELVSDWTVGNGTATANTVNFIYGTQCIAFINTASLTMTAFKTFASKNLTTFPDGSTSGENDYISLFLIRGVYDNFTSCTLEIGDGGSTNCHRIVLSGLTAWTATTAPDVAFEFKIRKSAFAHGGGTENWADVTGVKITIDGVAALQAQIIVDYLRLEKAGPTTADSAVTGLPSGTYYYRVTFVTQDGWESDPSVTSDAVTITLKKVTLTNIPVPGSTRIASKKIYRIGGTSAEWRLLTTLYDRTTPTYTDNTADVNLGDLQDITEGQPYIPKCLTVHDKTIIIANLTSFDNTAYPCGVMISEEGSVDIFDHDNFFEIEASFGGKINWLLDAMDFTYVGKSNSIWKFDSNDLSIPPRNLSRIYGGVGPLAVAAGENEIFFLDGAKRLISFNGSFFENIGEASPTRSSSIQNYLDLIPDAWIQTCWIRWYDNFLLVGIPQTGDQSPTLILAYYLPKRIWIVISGWAARCGYSAKIAGVNTLHLGHSSTGFVYNCFSPSQDTDAGIDITSIIQTSDGDFGEAEIRKDYAKNFLFAKKLTSTDVTLTLEPYIDTVDSTLDLSLTIDSTTHKRSEVPMPQMEYAGTFLGLKMTATKRWAFRSLFEYARMVGVLQ